MKPIEFKEQTVIIAKNQPQYLPLPAHVDDEVERRMTFCWELSLKERLKVLFGGKIWQQTLTFGLHLQPQLLSVEKPNLK